MNRNIVNQTAEDGSRILERGRQAPDAELRRILERVAGVDVHRDTLVVCALGKPGDPDHYETRTYDTFKKNIDSLAEWLKEAQVESVVMESTGIYWRTPYRILSAAGLNVTLGNARMIKNVPGRKTDKTDAQWLATLARAGLVPASRVLADNLYDLRELSRDREELNHRAAQIKNRIHGVMVDAGFNVNQVVTDLFGKTGDVIVNGLMDRKSPPEILASIECSLGYRLKAPREKLLDALEGELSDLKLSRLEAYMRSHDQTKRAIFAKESLLEETMVGMGLGPKIDLLETLPGVSRVGAMTLLAELGCDVSDFRSGKALCAWAGVVPRNNESAGKRRCGRILKGNDHLKTTLCENAQAAVRTDSYFKERFTALKARRGHKKAIVAIAHKILKIVYVMLTKGEPYVDKAVDYETLIVKRNTPRWLRRIAALKEKLGGLPPGVKARLAKLAAG